MGGEGLKTDLSCDSVTSRWEQFGDAGSIEARLCETKSGS